MPIVVCSPARVLPAQSTSCERVHRLAFCYAEFGVAHEPQDSRAEEQDCGDAAAGVGNGGFEKELYEHLAPWCRSFLAR